MKYSKLLLFIAILLSFVFLNGCFSSNPADIAAFKKPYEVNVTADKYVLQPADQIQILGSIPEINAPPQIIRPDGKVSFLHFGEIEAAGKTPTELADIIREKASKLYLITGEHPIDVRITVFQSHVYYVLGQVDKPGPKPYTGRDRALRALAEANPNIMSWGDRIQVIRPSYDPNQKPKIFELKWDPLVAHGDASKDVLLQEGDIIFVPPTVLAAIALKLEEFLTPIGRAFSTVWIVNNATTANTH
jgi:protein involved in polysaccharide export with SLBB domain